MNGQVVRGLLIALIGFATMSARAAEGDLPYIEMELCSPAPYDDARDYWDHTRTFCFVRNGTQYKYDVSQMGEIKLRENGNWVDLEYRDALSGANRDEVAGYKKYFVRYLSLGSPEGGITPFVVHVFFTVGIVNQTHTMFVFGQIENGHATLTGYHNSQGIEGDVRAILGGLQDLFNGKNPSNGAATARTEDTKRARPARDVVQHYDETKGAVQNPRN